MEDNLFTGPRMGRLLLSRGQAGTVAWRWIEYIEYSAFAVMFLFHELVTEVPRSPALGAVFLAQVSIATGNTFYPYLHVPTLLLYLRPGRSSSRYLRLSNKSSKPHKRVTSPSALSSP